MSQGVTKLSLEMVEALSTEHLAEPVEFAKLMHERRPLGRIVPRRVQLPTLIAK